MKTVEEIIERLETTDKVFSVLFPNEKIDLFIGGGIGCLLNGAGVRPTNDFDFIDLDYPAKYLRALNTIGDFDFIDITVSAIASDFKKRATKIFEGDGIIAFAISSVDIIVMKLNRLSDIDISDIKHLLDQSDVSLLIDLIEKAMCTLEYPKAREKYELNYKRFRSEVLKDV